jgi:hypothetical protein
LAVTACQKMSFKNAIISRVGKKRFTDLAGISNLMYNDNFKKIVENFVSIIIPADLIFMRRMAIPNKP